MDPVDGTPARKPRYPALDGWRAVSILLVLCAHMVPIGSGHLAATLASAGMAIFFSISGFLIADTLYYDASVRNFAIRRIFRIVPSAWLYIGIALTAAHADRTTWMKNLLFVPNRWPFYLIAGFNSHLWSLAVEMQFYLGLGTIFLVLRRRALPLLPIGTVLASLGNIHAGVPFTIETPRAIGQILAGASLAYLLHSPIRDTLLRWLQDIGPTIAFIALFFASNDAYPAFNYLRPYWGAALVGSSLTARPSLPQIVLRSTPMAYLAAISYALYLWHPLMSVCFAGVAAYRGYHFGWTLAILASFAIAHLSTFHFESRWIGLGRRLTATKPTLPTESPLTVAR